MRVAVGPTAAAIALLCSGSDARLLLSRTNGQEHGDEVPGSSLTEPLPVI